MKYNHPPRSPRTRRLARRRVSAAALAAALLFAGWAPAPQPLLVAAAGAALPLSGGEVSLSIPTTFTITRPEKKLTTSYESYFITGTSNPEQPVYFGDAEIQRQGTKGTFGVHVQLAMGTNRFTFRQGGESQTVVIVRTAPSGAAPIQGLVQDSIVPAVQSAVKVGETLELGCTAPAGATVQATFDGQTVALEPVKQGVKAGYPAEYTGSLTVRDSGYDPDTTAEAGAVRYEMRYKDATKTYTSSGQVYVAGKNADVIVEVTAYLGFVYPDTSDLSRFKETVQAGARDWVQGQDNRYYHLASGGFVPKEMAGVVLGKAGVQNKLSGAAFSKGAKAETIVFSGTRRPMYDTKIVDNTFHLTLYNTSGAPKPDLSGSRLLTGCTVSEADGAVTYQFPLGGRVWGYGIAFDNDKNTVLTLRYKPALSDSGEPLRGVTILLDPGHGGMDPGALGVAGKTGPAEAQINLAHALATRTALEKMGAKVVMTREEDSYISLDDRLQQIDTTGCDLFISLHHNSLGEQTDANKVNGLEVYYHTGLSAKAANTMMQNLAGELGRKNRSVSQSYYRVTLMHNTPAMLLELGFLSNPLEYEKSVSGTEIKKVAAAIANGVVASLQ